jgi:hypothetical protein
MWEHRRLTTLWAFTACYRDSLPFFVPFTLYILLHASVLSKCLANLILLNLNVIIFGEEYKFWTSFNRYSLVSKSVVWRVKMNDSELMTARFSVNVPDFHRATVQRLALSRFLLVNKRPVKCAPDLQYAPEHDR